MTVFIDAEKRGRQLNRLIADEDDVAIAAATAAELLVSVELADDARCLARATFVRSVLDTVRSRTTTYRSRGCTRHCWRTCGAPAGRAAPMT
jgi:hypothetical protein